MNEQDANQKLNDQDTTEISDKNDPEGDGLVNDGKSTTADVHGDVLSL